MKFFNKILYHLCKVKHYIGVVGFKEVNLGKEIALHSTNYQIVIYGLLKYQFKDKRFYFLKLDSTKNIEFSDKSVCYWVRILLKEYQYRVLYVNKPKNWIEMAPR